MTQPLTLDKILNDLSDADKMWVLQDRASEQYVVIPDSRYPGRRPIRFFMKREDADSLLSKLVEVNAKLTSADIVPIKVKLKPALIGIASDQNPNHADAFVVHSPNEVFEYLWSGD